MSRFWTAAWPRLYRLLRLLEWPIRTWTRRYGLGDTVEVTIVRRRTGRPWSVLLGLLRVRGDWYVGHPNGVCGWTRDLDAAGKATIGSAGLGPVTVRAVLLPVGEERTEAIQAAFRQHPFPGNVVYWLARRHVRAVGRYYRLDILDVDESVVTADLGGGGGGSSPGVR